MDIYIVKGEKKEHFFDDKYTEFEKEVNASDLIALINNPRIIINEVKRKVK